jgi:hypothetical protein
MHLAAALCAALCVLLFAGCGSRIAGPPAGGGPAELPASANHAGLPRVPAPGLATRRVSENSRYTFGQLDIIDNSPDAFMEEDGLWMDTLFSDQLQYAVFSAVIDRGTPERLDVLGLNQGLWIGVADFEHDRWLWLGDGINMSELFAIPDAWVLGPNDEMYICALIMPSGSCAGTDISVVVNNDDPGDEDPPTWTNGEGITDLRVEGGWLIADYGFAADAGTGAPVTYLVYVAPSHLGINWSMPYWVLPENELHSEGLEYSINMAGVPTDVAVRAMDVKGNITTNTDFLSATIPVEEPPAMLLGEWQPGETIRLRWDNPEADLALSVIAPNFDEGDARSRDLDAGGISFLVAPDSLETGVAEERVVLFHGARGHYKVILGTGDGAADPGQATIEILAADGSVRQTLGIWSGTEIPQGERDVAWLSYWP